MATTLYLYESLQRLLEYAELDANFKNLRTTADGAATKAGTVLTSGVTLGNTAQAGATVLDWYEEGTFTPVLRDSAGGNAATCTAYGSYVRVGKAVHFLIILVDIVTTGLVGANQVYITGLPFVSLNYPTGFQPVNMVVSNISSPSGSTLMYVEPNSGRLRCSNGTTTGGGSLLVSQILSGYGDIYSAGSYLV